MIVKNRYGEQADNPVPCSKSCSWKKGLKIKEKRTEMEQMNSNFYISQKNNIFNTNRTCTRMYYVRIGILCFVVPKNSV